MLVSGLSHGATKTLYGLLAVSLSAIFCTGCGGDTSGRVPLAGEVTLDGEPLDTGTIEFHPEGNSGILTGGKITNGRFEIPAEQGAMPGTYTVRIFSSTGGESTADPDAPPGPEAAQQPVATQLIPSQYNTDSELTVTVDDGGAEDLQFDLES